ncbi:AAA family ATPase, partial [Roseibium sp.]|uniref:AAA family ATPase n=1 Tax=Roseibium sp. TaxID=1936156 RepID=UPI0032974104
MLQSWSLKNFKSYKELDALTLSSINILAGANSSGKSTIIQSILLLKQTLQYGSADRPVALNGPLLRMGAFSDIRNNEASGGDVGIGFEFNLEGDDSRDASSTWMRELNRSNYMNAKSHIKNISVEFSLDEEKDLLGMFQNSAAVSPNPSMSQVQLLVTRLLNDEVVQDASLKLTRRHPDQEVKNEYLHFDYNVKLDSESEATILEDLPDAFVVGAFTRAFLPFIVGVDYDRGAEEAESIFEGLFSKNTSLVSRPFSSDVERVPQEAMIAIRKWLESSDAGEHTLSLIDREKISEKGIVLKLQEVLRHSAKRNISSRYETTLFPGT